MVIVVILRLTHFYFFIQKSSGKKAMLLDYSREFIESTKFKVCIITKCRLAISSNDLIIVLVKRAASNNQH